MRYSQIHFNLMVSIFSWQMNEGFITKVSNDSIQIRNCSDIPIPGIGNEEWTQCPESKYMIEHELIQCYQAEMQHRLEGT